MPYYAITTKSELVGTLAHLTRIVDGINRLGRDWSLTSGNVRMVGDDLVMLVRYSGSTNVEAGRTELERYLGESKEPLWLDMELSNDVNLLDGVTV